VDWHLPFLLTLEDFPPFVISNCPPPSLCFQPVLTLLVVLFRAMPIRFRGPSDPEEDGTTCSMADQVKREAAERGTG
jgi:hypothetical protein